MKSVTKYIFLTLLICSAVVVSCNRTQKKNKSNLSKTDTLTQKQRCIVDSLKIDFLEKTSYENAIAACSLTIVDRDFVLNEIVIFGLRANLGNIFTKEELASNIRLKEVTWDGKDGDYITVWYRKHETSWNPIDIFKYGKGTRF